MRRRALPTSALIVALTIGSPAAARPVSGARLLFRLADPRVDEASGIAPGRVSPGVFYVENDSGDRNRFFALNRHTGATAAVITVAGARNVDWEDIAVASDGGDRSSVWLADIGDNGAARREIEVYRVPEPQVRAADRDRALQVRVSGVWRLRYPTGPVDAESLAVAPDGTAYLVTKSPASAVVYRLPPRPDAGHVQLLQRVGVIGLLPTSTPNPFGLAGQLVATSAAFARDGSVFAIRTYADAYVWPVGAHGLAAALRRPPQRVALPEQPQGEGIAIVGRQLVIDSERRDSAVYSLPLPAAFGAAPPDPLSPSRVNTSVPAAQVRAPSGGGSALFPALGAATGAVVLAAAGGLVWRRRRRPRGRHSVVREAAEPPGARS